jgi:hypothetical protein
MNELHFPFHEWSHRGAAKPTKGLRNFDWSFTFSISSLFSNLNRVLFVF